MASKTVLKAFQGSWVIRFLKGYSYSGSRVVETQLGQSRAFLGPLVAPKGEES
ncbi:hypothetical protein RchiOBHm_Chr7g0233211 [Rosa chinensis]|uniref:Uncharacterized protein n=1 Tax=Rosa chinensis TaxID=74649 RepID=A0A2P6PG41_ROSCH|nr:hypothetical protein RchiOBHm_Chr7g0233211 [Rosa chinensis]